MRRVFGASGALACAFAVALGAYASHAAQGHDRQRLALAALFAFGHGLALVSTASRHSRLSLAGKFCFLAGILAFSGSLAGAAFFSMPTAAAPFGGGLLIAGWLLIAVDALLDQGERHG